jgi:uncharacterized membrane protein YeiH
VVVLAHPELERLRRPIDVMDAAGLSLFCVTGAIAGLEGGFGVPEAIVLGVLSGIGGGIMRDVLLGEIPVVFRRGLYAVPALVGAALVTVAYRAGERGLGFAVAAAATCFALRLTGLRFDLGLPTPAPASERFRRGRR